MCQVVLLIYNEGPFGSRKRTKVTPYNSEMVPLILRNKHVSWDLCASEVSLHARSSCFERGESVE